MRYIGNFILSLLVLALTSTLILANPLVIGFEYSLKKGWVKFPKTFKGRKVL
jgi:hypothetical protein